MAISLRRVLQLVATLALGCSAALVGATPAHAAVAKPDAAIRAAHFSPTTPGVDVYLGRFSGNRPPTTLWLSKVRYGAVSPYQALTPGVYSVAMRPAGAPAAARPMLTWTLNAKPHTAYTVAGVGAGGSVRGVVVKDNLSAPPAGHGRVRVIQAASRAPVATVTATGGHVISRRVHFASVSSYATLPAGTWRVKAFSTSTPSEAATGPVTIRSGQITSILLLDAKSKGITLRTVLDSASSSVMPAGAVPAGGGGTARDIINAPSRGHLAAIATLTGAGAVLLSAAVLSGYGARRRSRGARDARA